MIQQETLIQIVDNSGVKSVKCLKILGSPRKSYGFVGDLIKASVQELRFNRSKKNNYTKGELVFCFLVSTKSKIRRKNGQFLHFLKNTAILVDKNYKPIATRISGPLLKEFRNRNFLKILSLSQALI